RQNNSELFACSLSVLSSVTELCSVLIFFFFFSSRRRHTRLQGDWSSDVCSSDLRLPAHEQQRRACQEPRTPRARPLESLFHDTRSEERRVGKECRCRWGPDD